MSLTNCRWQSILIRNFFSYHLAFVIIEDDKVIKIVSGTVPLEIIYFAEISTLKDGSGITNKAVIIATAEFKA